MSATSWIIKPPFGKTLSCLLGVLYVCVCEDAVVVCSETQSRCRFDGSHTTYTLATGFFFFVCPFCRETLVAFSELGHFNIHVGISGLATMKADQLQVVALAAARGWALELFVTTIEKCSAGEKRRERTQNSLEAES